MQHMFWVKIVKFDNLFVIFSTTKKNSNEIKKLLVGNFGLNQQIPKGSIFGDDDQDIDVNTDDEKDKAGDSGEKNPLIEIRDSVPPLKPSSTRNNNANNSRRGNRLSGDWSLLTKANIISVSDILFSLLNHSLICILPNTDRLIQESRYIIDDTMKIHYMQRKSFI
jgi:hypothetical protein